MSHSFRGKARANAFAFWGSVIGVAIVLGPVAGGFITHYFGWQWAFYVNIPVGVAMIGLTSYALDESHDPHSTNIDYLGFVTFSGSLFLITLCLISGNQLPTYIGANIAGVTYAATLLTMLTLIPMFLQSRLDYSPHQAGLLMLPIAVPLIVMPRIVAIYLAYRFSGRALLSLWDFYW